MSRGQAVEGLRCGPRPKRRSGTHLEIFARGHVVQIPSGIGIAPPERREGAYVRGGRCWYPLFTTEPTGVVESPRKARLTLGSLFAVWGEPLSHHRLLSFRARAPESVEAFVDGRRIRTNPRSIPLVRHEQIVLEVSDYVPPHPAYRFPPGL